ncbi:9350_t:CDS:2 [Paraglomus occultum]|uniref:9350_t:CDS:1 n=1 Tax=Paraglomus occultum TaxID=144539 RepID=A0A9N9F3R7_9GLOM|nr:9350_t:CDS:2 [Paraglomus occultum]
MADTPTPNSDNDEDLPGARASALTEVSPKDASSSPRDSGDDAQIEDTRNQFAELFGTDTSEDEGEAADRQEQNNLEDLPDSGTFEPGDPSSVREYGEEETYDTVAFDQRKLSLGLDNKYYVMKVPNFLSVNTKPFVPNEYDDKEEMESKDGIKLAGENTIRWREIRNSSTDEIKKQTNTKIVRWSDGSMSLLVGEELFDMSITSLHSQFQYLSTNYPNESIMEMQGRLTDQVTVKPFGTTGSTHRKIAAVIASRHVKQIKTRMVATDRDPELRKLELAKAEKEQIRAQRRADYRRSRKAYESRRAREDDYLEEDIRPIYRSRNDSYEDGGDFVVDDDVDMERVADNGAEEEGQDDEDEDEDDVVVIKRPKKRARIFAGDEK